MLRKRWWMTLLQHRRWLKAVIDVKRLETSAPLLERFVADWEAYESLAGAEQLREEDALACLYDRLNYTPFDAHYMYQSIWAINRVRELGVRRHVDVGSLGLFVGMLTAITEVESVDIRPLSLGVERFHTCRGSVTQLPYEDASVPSVSCLHVIEHVGLGRYGDPLEPQGSIKALRELARVVAPGGRLLLSTPVGRPRTQFNAHRIHDPLTVLEVLAPLKLVNFAVVDDEGRYIGHADPSDYRNATYACGLFEMARRSGGESTA